MIVVVNAARSSWQAGEYGLWVGGGSTFKQVYCSQVGGAVGGAAVTHRGSSGLQGGAVRVALV